MDISMHARTDIGAIHTEARSTCSIDLPHDAPVKRGRPLPTGNLGRSAEIEPVRVARIDGDGKVIPGLPLLVWIGTKEISGRAAHLPPDTLLHIQTPDAEQMVIAVCNQRIDDTRLHR